MVGDTQTAALIGDIDSEGWQSIQAMVQTIGSSAIESLKAVLDGMRVRRFGGRHSFALHARGAVRSR